MTITTANHSYSIAQRLDRGLKCGMMLAVLATVGACGSGETPGPAETGGAQGVGGSGTQATTSATTSTSSAATGGATQATSNAGGASNVGGTKAVGGASAPVGGASAAVSGTKAAGGASAAGGTKAVGGGSAAVGGGSAAVGGASAAVGGTKAAGGASAAVGGTKAAGGASAAVGGASVAVGGASVAVGGASAANGGASAAVGGTKAAGGASAAVGGASAAVGGASAAVGGTKAAGGATAAAGAPAGGATAAGGAGGAAGGSFVEDDGTDCTVAVPTSGSDSKLPDPFMKIDKTRIATKADWRCRRQEIVKMAYATAYGNKPAKPTTVTGTVTESKITVNVANGSNSASFSATVSAPTSGSKPYPAIINFVMAGFSSLSIDQNVLNSEGVAVISLDVTTIGGETGTSRSRSGAFFTVNPNDKATGTLMAWAWGVSRIIDVIEQSDGTILKADAIGVTGCSRFGKGAFVAGAFDQRVALGIPMESGSGGAPIWRGIPGEGAQSLSSAYGEQPWLGDAFTKNTSNPAGYLIDTHEVVALYAPRGLLILDNAHIANLGPKSAHVAALGGAEVYKALGAADRIAYHSESSNGTHCSVRSEYTQPLKDAVQRFLTKKGTAAGVIKAYSSTTGKLSDWATWTTPTLQ